MAKIIYLNKVNKAMDFGVITKDRVEELEDNDTMFKYNTDKVVAKAVSSKFFNYDTSHVLEELKTVTPEDIVNTYNPEGIYPFDILQVINKMGFLVVPYDFRQLEQTDFKEQVKEKGKILGAVIANNRKIAIFYDKDSSIHRINFTLAHELAHCCLDLNLDINSGRLSHMEFRNDSQDHFDIKEYRANIFAGEILIPKKPLDYVFENLIEPSVYNLSKFFGVSQSVMRARLKYLGYIK